MLGASAFNVWPWLFITAVQCTDPEKATKLDASWTVKDACSTHLKDFRHFRPHQMDAQHPIGLSIDNHLDVPLALIVCQ